MWNMIKYREMVVWEVAEFLTHPRLVLCSRKVAKSRLMEAQDFFFFCGVWLGLGNIPW